MSVLDERVKILLEGLSSALNRLADGISAKSVHRLRTTIRRIESLVAFTAPDLGRKQQRALKDLTALRKRAGKVRDLDVQTGLLDAIANGSVVRDRRALADLLKKKRTKQAQRVRSAITKIRSSKLSVHLQRIGEKAAAVPVTDGLPLKEARQQLSSLAAEFTSRQPVQPRLLHQVRIRMKMIRYLAELSEESADQKRFLDALKSAQDALGAWHDWEELTAIAEKEFGGRLNCPLLVEVRSLFTAKYAAATAAVAHLFSLDSGALARKQPSSAEATVGLARRA